MTFNGELYEICVRGTGLESFFLVFGIVFINMVILIWFIFRRG